MASVDLDAIRSQWLGYKIEQKVYTARQQSMVDWAVACGETEPRFVDPDDEDFQAHPTFVAHLVSRRMLPREFPRIGSGHGVDGGKSVAIERPIRVGDELTADCTVAEIYEKTGRSGTMYFVVHRSEFTNQNGDHVASVDWRMIQR